MIEERPFLANLQYIIDIPHIQAVIIVYTGHLKQFVFNKHQYHSGSTSIKIYGVLVTRWVKP